MGERNFQTPKSPSPPCPPSSDSNTAVPRRSRRQCSSTPGGGTAGWPGGWSVRALRGGVGRDSSLFPRHTLTSKGTCEAGRGRGTEPQTPHMQSSSGGGHSRPVFAAGLLWDVGGRHAGAEQRGPLQERQRALQIILKFGGCSRACCLSLEEVVSAGCPFACVRCSLKTPGANQLTSSAAASVCWPVFLHLTATVPIAEPSLDSV